MSAFINPKHVEIYSYVERYKALRSRNPSQIFNTSTVVFETELMHCAKETLYVPSHQTLSFY